MSYVSPAAAPTKLPVIAKVDAVQSGLVYIVVLSWNRCIDVLQCLVNIQNLEYRRTRVLVVDNGSTDGTVDDVKIRHPNVETIVNPRNLGYAGGANVGIRHALKHGAEFVWLLNDDTYVPPSTLGALVAEARASARIGAVSPIVHYGDQPDRVQFAGTYVNCRSATVVGSLRPGGNFAKTWNVPVLPGVALLIKSRALEDVGLLDERLFAYWEDFDFSMRLHAADWEVKVVECERIKHSATAGSESSFVRAPHYFYLMTRNQFFFWRRYRRGCLRRTFYFLQFLAEALPDAAMSRYRGRSECADACLDGVWDAFRGRAGPFDTRGRMPSLLRQMCSWHPFFWAAVFRGSWIRLWAKARPARSH